MYSYEEGYQYVNLDSSVAYHIRRLARLLRIELNQVLAESPGNLTAEQWIILLQLHNKGHLNQHELTDAVLQDRANIARHLNNLETNGYIERTQDEQDARHAVGAVFPGVVSSALNEDVAGLHSRLTFVHDRDEFSREDDSEVDGVGAMHAG